MIAERRGIIRLEIPMDGINFTALLMNISDKLRPLLIKLLPIKFLRRI